MKNRKKLNDSIEALVKAKGDDATTYSEEEKTLIAQYSGAGGKGNQGATGQGVLYEYFTPSFVAADLWKLAYVHGFPKGGKVLEPSIGTGKLIADAPDKSKVVGFEINPVSASICRILYPESTIYNEYLETAFLEKPRFTSRLNNWQTWLDAPFDLIIGNPPYGIYKNRFSRYFSKPKFAQIEFFFMYAGIELLRPGGLLIYLIPSAFLRNGDKYDDFKNLLGEKVVLQDAYRLPPIFESSKIPVDILILKKK